QRTGREHEIRIGKWISKVSWRGVQVVDDVIGFGSEVHANARSGKRRICGERNLVLHQRSRNAQRGTGLSGEAELVAPGIGHVLKDRLAVVTDRNIQRTGDLQL